jgi:putative ABC transport system permease protein
MRLERWRYSLPLRLRGLLRRERLETDLTDELRDHLEHDIEARVVRGVPIDQARQEAIRAMAGFEQRKEECRDVAGVRILDEVLADLRYARRTLGRSPGFTAVAVLTLALGIGATTVLFSVTYGVLLRPLPWANPDRLVRLTETRQGRSGRVPGTISNPAYLAWSDRPGTIEAIGGYTRGVRMTLAQVASGLSRKPLDQTATDASAERVVVMPITPSVFTVLKASPLLGRLFTADEGAPGQAGAIILGFGLWQQRFGARQDIVGRTVQLDEKPYTVVGVMPASFAFPTSDARAWVPLAIMPVGGPGGVVRGMIFQAMARLKPGVTPEQAAAEATARARNAPAMVGGLATALFGADGPIDISAVPAVDALTADVRPALIILLVAVSLLLGTASANVASIQLARANTRGHEMAVRSAIGAGVARLSRQLLTESSVLGLAGGVGGLLLALAIQRALLALLPPDFPRIDAITLDQRVLAFATLLSVSTSVACGLVPAFHVRRADLLTPLTDAAAVGGGPRLRVARARTVIMAGQIAVACVLLVGAALLARSVIALSRADRGYDPLNVLTAELPLPPRYANERRQDFLEGLLARVRAQPGVASAAFSTSMPLVGNGGPFSSFKVRSPRDQSAEVEVEAALRIVSPGYFEALRLRVVAGRPLASTDTATAPPVAVVNRSFARRYLDGIGVGQSIPGHVGRGPGFADREVVGVVDDGRQPGADSPPLPEVFLTAQQVSPSWLNTNPFLVIRADRDPASLAPTLRALVRDQDPLLALDNLMTMEERVMGSLARPRLYAVLLGAFAAFALAIVAVGLFGVLSYSMAQRSKEIAVRSALGASPGRIVRIVLGQTALVAGAGLSVGLLAASLLTTYLSKLLYGVRPRDTLVYVAVAGVVALTAGVASVIPARRSAKVDPWRVLRA